MPNTGQIIDGWYYPDVGAAIEEESARRKGKRYQRELSSYIDADNYEGAEKAALRYGDFDAAKSYGAYDERADQRAYSKEVNPFIASGDYKGALGVAVRSNRPTQEVSQLAQSLKALNEEKLTKARESNARLGMDLQAIEQLPPNQRQVAYAQKRAEYAANGVDVSGVPEVWSPGLSRKLINEALSVEKAIDLEFEERKFAEDTRHSRVIEARSRGGRTQWRPATPEEMAAYGTDSPFLIDDETGNVKTVPGAKGNMLAGAEQRGRIVLAFPNMIEALTQMDAAEKKAHNSHGGTPYGQDWGARLAEAAPWDGGSVSRVVGGQDYTDYEAASKSFEQSIMPAFAGSAVTESEAQRFVRANQPRFGDNYETLKKKGGNRKRIANAAAIIIGEQPPYPDAGYWTPKSGLVRPQSQDSLPSGGTTGAPRRIKLD